MNARSELHPGTAEESARYDGYNFAYLDERTKRMIRRALLKAVAIPGYQVPFGSREMPLPYGWGTGGIQVTASIIGADDTLKVIDQGADDTVNAVNIRRFFQRTTGVATTERTTEATLIQTRHRIPETPLAEGQIIIYQVPIPEPLAKLEPREAETKVMHGLAEYGLMHVKLYEDIARHGHIATTYDYPVLVDGRFLMSPSPIPKFDNPKMHRNPALQLFGAGREKRLYAIPPYTTVESLAFEDHPFEVQTWQHDCALCGSTESFLDEVITDDQGGRMFLCSDTDYCSQRRAASVLQISNAESGSDEIPPAPLFQRGDTKPSPHDGIAARATSTPPFEKGARSDSPAPSAPPFEKGARSDPPAPLAPPFENGAGSEPPAPLAPPSEKGARSEPPVPLAPPFEKGGLGGISAEPDHKVSSA